MPKNKILTIYFLLSVAALLAFWKVTSCDFINFDDPEYVTENIHVQHGLTVEGIRWAFTTDHAGNWHPLTWVSLMVDAQLFGLDSRWYHLTNLLFHIANTLLLFFVFNRMTEAPWKSAFVAALFALHPLHVESVAWVAERKDVLSTFFWMLTIVAYIHYVEHPRPGTFLGVFTIFALGLMAKPMLVTLPFVLLLLDYWPLQRFGPKRSAQGLRTGATRPVPVIKRNMKLSGKKPVSVAMREQRHGGHKYESTFNRYLLLEKAPLFALTAISCVLTFIAQQRGGGVVSLERIPPLSRIANAFISYAVYVAKAILPANLAVYYPYQSWAPWQVLGAALLFIAVTSTVISAAGKRRYLAVGWLWYAGTLAPVIGLVQVGAQAWADRYTYIPLIGLFIIVAWGIPDLLGNWRYRKEALILSSTLTLACLFTVTWTQVGYWRNSVTLFGHALNVTNNNYAAYYNRGNAYKALGNSQLAIMDYDKAIAITPNDAWLFNNRAASYDSLGNHRQAISDYDRAIQINPNLAEFYSNRGVAYAAFGNYEQAIVDYDRAIEIDPRIIQAYYNRGLACAALGNYKQAVVDYDRVIRINPKDAGAYSSRGDSYFQLGNYVQAIVDYDRAIEIDPGIAELYVNRAISYARLDNHEQEVEDLRRAARLNNQSAQNVLRSRGISW
jgi:tetratricopeptide (TPR) repeat protein